MTTSEQATALIAAQEIPLQTETVPLEQATGRVLAEDLLADRPFPPFHRVTMDGIALMGEAILAGQRAFSIAGIQAAGAPRGTLHQPAHCMEVMTGAVLPEGTDTVVRYEDIEITAGIARIAENVVVNPGQNIHREGSDRKPGDLLVARGTRISPAEIATAATIGRSTLQVVHPPATLIFATGDELVPVSEIPAAHQIRISNVYAIQSALQMLGVPAEIRHIPDDEQAIRHALELAFQDARVIILSGGVSEGKYDFIPKILTELGVETLFHKVAQRPGKPFWFGRGGQENIVFAPPGNPVSTFMVTCRYILPWFRQHLQMGITPTFARLTEQVIFQPDLQYFLQVRLQMSPEAVLEAIPIQGKGSGDLANLNDAAAFLELPRGRPVFNAGEVFPVYIYRI